MLECGHVGVLGVRVTGQCGGERSVWGCGELGLRGVGSVRECGVVGVWGCLVVGVLGCGGVKVRVVGVKGVGVWGQCGEGAHHSACSEFLWEVMCGLSTPKEKVSETGTLFPMRSLESF